MSCLLTQTMSRASTQEPTRAPTDQLSFPEQGGVCVQSLTLVLDGITPVDYLTWVRDPEPRTLDRDLRSATVQAHALGDQINLQLVWDREPPPAQAALLAAGFAATPELIELHSAT